MEIFEYYTDKTNSAASKIKYNTEKAGYFDVLEIIVDGRSIKNMIKNNEEIIINNHDNTSTEIIEVTDSHIYIYFKHN